MKRSIFICGLLTLSAFNLLSQRDSAQHPHRNEIGFDITNLFFFVRNASSSGNFYTPTYFLSYRRHFAKGNVRAGAGGYYSQRTSGVYKIDGEDRTFTSTQSLLSLRLGYEWVSELSRRMQVFYGLDFRPSFSSSINPAQLSNGGYLAGHENRAQMYGLGPVLGFRFRISRRLSILTETALVFTFEKSRTQRKFMSMDSNLYPYMPDEPQLKTDNFYSTFILPAFLVLTFDL